MTIIKTVCIKGYVHIKLTQIIGPPIATEVQEQDNKVNYRPDVLMALYIMIRMLLKVISLTAYVAATHV